MKSNAKNKKNKFQFEIPPKVKKYLFGFFLIFFAIIFLLAFFQKAGTGGKILLSLFYLFFGKGVYLLPFILFLSALSLFISKFEKFNLALLIANFISLISLSALLEILRPKQKIGGLIGSFFGIFTKIFGSLFLEIIFILGLTFSGLIFWYLIFGFKTKEKKEKTSLIKRIIFSPKVHVTPLETISKPSVKEKTAQIKEKKIEKPKPEIFISEGYKLPPPELLEEEKGEALAGDIQQNSLIIKRTLENFGIPVQTGQVKVGPTVTQYTLKPAEGIKLSKITSLSNDLALALASHPIRIEAPIPGKSLVGIEVPNKVRSLVRLRNLVSNLAFKNAPSLLTIVLGRDVIGEPVYADIARMPHLLVAGATGTGKSIFLNTIILSLLYRNSPETLRFILVDPKRVEFPIYNDLPHLLVPVIWEPNKVVLALSWLIGEMERRFDILSETKTRDINSYNALVKKEKKSLMPYIILIIDELADLMAAKGKEIEAGIVRIAQMARAVGIHLIVATQRPSVEVLTGLIKANITTRVSFQVASQFDSRTILDTAGAEKLLGRGDFLFLSAENPKPKRIQAPFVSEAEINRVVEFIIKENAGWKTAKYEAEMFTNNLREDLIETLSQEESEYYFEKDPLYEEAKRLVVEAQKASASFLQRRLSIGYARAARLLDMLEEEGVIGPPEGAKPRKVLIPPPQKEDEEGWKKV